MTTTASLTVTAFFNASSSNLGTHWDGESWLTATWPHTRRQEPATSLVMLQVFDCPTASTSGRYDSDTRSSVNSRLNLLLELPTEPTFLLLL
jgi:hypothetical protein